MLSKILALILSVCMLFTSAPLGGVFEELSNLIESATADLTEEKLDDKAGEMEVTTDAAASVFVSTAPILTLKSGATFTSGTPVTVSSDKELSSLTLTADSGMSLSSTYTLTTVGEGVTKKYIYKYTVTGGTYSGTSYTVTITANYTYDSVTSTAKTTAKVLKSPVSTNSLNFKFDLSYKRQDSWGSVTSNPELKYTLSVSGLHKVSTGSTFSKSGSAKSSDYDDAKTWELNYGDISSTYNGRFYYDTNTSNTIGAAYGATTLSNVKFSIYNPTNIMGEDGTPDGKEVRFVANYEEYMRPDLDKTYKSIDLLTMDTPATVDWVLSSAPYSSRNTNGVDTVKYTTTGIASCTNTSASVRAKYIFAITYEWVNSTVLWNIYKAENTLNRFAYADLYKESDSVAWSDYLTAYTNATTILAGGYSQSAINSAATDLVDAVRALKTKVIYDKNGGTGDCEEYDYIDIYSDVSITADKIQAPVYLYSDAILTSYSSLSKVGYKCTGWAPDSTATQGSTQLTVTDTETKVPKVLYAAWNPVSYSVVYNANKPLGATTVVGTMPTQECLYGQEYFFLPNEFTITNYNFAGWNTMADGSGTMYYPGDKLVNLTENNETVNIYAIWQTGEINVTFNINLPSGVTETTSGLKANTTQAFEIGKVINLADYQMDAVGYRHLGWSTKQAATTPTFTIGMTVPQVPTTLYAVWQLKSVKVNYALNGGTLLEGNYTPNGNTVSYAESVILPSGSEVIRDGYNLVGWKSSIDNVVYTESFTVPNTNSTSVTFTAEWGYGESTIILHDNNIEMTDSTRTITGTYMSTLDKTLLAAPEKTAALDGYTFAGWYTKDGSDYIPYAIPATFPLGEVELYAGWQMTKLAELISAVPADINDVVNGNAYYYYPKDEKDAVLLALSDAEYVYGTSGVVCDPIDLRIANLTMQTLEISLAVLSYNPPSFSAFTEALQNDANAIIENSVIYDSTYRSSLSRALAAVNRALNNSKLTIKDDQAYVDGLIETLKNLVDNPVYRAYTITFHYNAEGVADVFDTVSVPCNASIAGKAPTETPEREGYIFSGWFTTPEDTADEIGTMIDFEATTEVMGTADRDVYARWEVTDGGFVLDIKGTNATINVAFYENELTNKGTEYYNSNVFRGTPVVLKADATIAEADFLCWVDSNGRIVSTDAEYDFVLVADTKLEAIYSQGNNRESYNVIFADGVTKKIINITEVAANTRAAEPSLINHIGYIFTGYSDSLNITKDTIIYAEYVIANDKYTVTVKDDAGILNPTGEYAYNTKVTVSLNELSIPEGKYFAGWSFDGGKTVVSYETTYTFYVYGNTEIEALFADTRAEKISTVTIEMTDKTEDSVAFMVSREIADGEFFLSSGILVTKDATQATEEFLTLDNESENDAIRNFTTVNNDKAGQYKLTVSTNTSDSEYFARGYIVYRDTEGKIKIKYTEIINATI